MTTKELALGLDLSTQSLSSAVVDITSREKVFEHSLDYRKDSRLNGFGIRDHDYIVPPRVEGEADQPPEMYFASLDALFSDLRAAGVALEDVVVVNHSGQQHAHVYLNRHAKPIFSKLSSKGSGQSDLVALLEGSLAYGTAPIWMTSNTKDQAAFVRNRVGGKARMIDLSGSDAPLRFTGLIIRRVAEQFPEAYKQTTSIQLISGLLSAVLTGNSAIPVDFGNACGMALMDYERRQWSKALIQAVSDGLPGGEAALASKLPEIVPPDLVVGSMATYFSERYGFSPRCAIVAGSGDNPQSKVLVPGDLLSLGTSFVNMVVTDGKQRDTKGYANAMYDGIGRPFLFGCRTNGALVWDQLRAKYGLKKEEYGKAEKALQEVPVAGGLVFWQLKHESFPPSGKFDLLRVRQIGTRLGTDYGGLIDSALSALYRNSKHFTVDSKEPLFVTGGATGSPGIMRRVAAIWNRKIIPLEKGGAALGAAVGGAYAFLKWAGKEVDFEEFSEEFLKKREPILPRMDDVAAYHGPDGYLERFGEEETRLTALYPP